MGGSIYVGENFGSVTMQDSTSALEVAQNFGTIEPWDFVPDPIDVDEHLLNRPVDPELIDFELVKSWLHVCEHGHEHRGKMAGHADGEGESKSSQSLSELRLVDVQNQCIVSVALPQRYMTLSYAWGGIGGMQLTLANHAALHVPYSLRDLKLPKTISDAIHLVSKLGERYLWIDMLCIKQDSVEDKRHYIGNMAQIYSNTVLTILAVEGHDAHAGLSRVRSRYHYTPSLYKGLPHGGDLADTRWIQSLEGTWASRSWTYQETVLSPRLLLVQELRAMFFCGKIHFTEGVHPSRPVTHPRLEGIISKLDRRNSLEVYEHAIYVYSRMKLTFDEDILNAFDGILSQLRPYLRSRFVFGLPETELVSALSWRCHKVKRAKQVTGMNEKGHKMIIRRVDPSTGVAWGPNWSWMGWKGGVHYDYAVWRHEEMVFFMVAEETEMQKIEGPWTAKEETGESFRSSGSSGETWNYGLGPYDPRFYWHDDEPTTRFANPTCREKQRPCRVFIEPGTSRLQLRGLCLSLDVLHTSQLEIFAGPPTQTLKHIPAIDHENFRAGELDLCLLQAGVVDPAFDLSSSKLELVLRLSAPSFAADEVGTDGSLFLLQLSRFVGMAGTQEAPHRGERQRLEPREREHQDKLNNLKAATKITRADLQSSPDPFSAAEREAYDEKTDRAGLHWWTYDPRRFETEKYYPFANVLVLQWQQGVAYRVGIGQVHVDAFAAAEPQMRALTLG